MDITQKDIDKTLDLFLEESTENPEYACEIANALISYLMTENERLKSLN